MNYSVWQAGKPKVFKWGIIPVIFVGLIAGAFVAPLPTLAQGDPTNLVADLTIPMLKLPRRTSPGAEFGSDTLLQIYNQGTASAAGFNIEIVISGDRDAPIKNAIMSTTFKEDAMLPGGRFENMPNMEPEETYTFSLDGLTMVTDAPVGEVIYVCAVVDPEHLIDEEWRKWPLGIGVNKLCMGINIVQGAAPPVITPEPPADEPPVEQPPTGTPPRIIPPTVVSDDLTQFDDDENCLLSDIEFFAIMDFWTAEVVTNGTFFTAIDAWMTQSNICVGASINGAISIDLNVRGLMISPSRGNSLKSVVIYDTFGRKVSSMRENSAQFFWEFRDFSGQIVPNGVYLVNVMYNTFDGALKSEIHKILVMR